MPTNGQRSTTSVGAPPVVSTKTRRTDRSRSLTLSKSKGTQSKPTLDHKKLIVNLSHWQLTPVEEEVLALRLSFAVAPRNVPIEEIIAATEATAHRQDPSTAHTLRTEIAEALKSTKPCTQTKSVL